MQYSKKSENTEIEKLTPVTRIDIKSIAEKSNGNDIFLSIYLPAGNKEAENINKSFLISRIRDIRKALPDKFKSQFENILKEAEGYCNLQPLKGEKGRILFVSQSNIYLYRIPLEPERYLILDNSPFILPLARLRDDYNDYGIILVDSREARLFCVRSDAIEKTKHLSTDLMNKHKKGGWSQMRFNHLRKEAIKSFLTNVVDSIQKYCNNHQVRGLIIAGPGDAKNQLNDMLPAHIKNKVMKTIDSPIDVSDKVLVDTGDNILLDNEHSYSRKKAEDFKATILSGGLAEYGIDSIKDALYQGRVNVLLILENIAVPGKKCEKCHEFHVIDKSQPNCPICGEPTTEAEIIEELYEMAQNTGAEIEFVDNDQFLESVGGIGALLRF